MKITTCIIAKNEENNIRTCIKSAKLISADIIVVDTGSTDKTVEVAESLGAKVYFRQWDDDFSAAKNYALDRAVGDWIFFPDADEYIDEDTAKIILKKMKEFENIKAIDALAVSLYNIDKKSGQITTGASIIRFFRNQKDVRYYGKVHERLSKSGRNMQSFGLEDAKLFHTGYSFDILQQKQARNLKLLLDLEEKGEADSSTIYYIAGSLCVNGEYEKSIDYVSKLEKRDDFSFLEDNFHLMYNLHMVKTEAMLKLESNYSYEDIIKAIDYGINKYPTQPILIEQKINIQSIFGKYDDALFAYNSLIALYSELSKKREYSYKRELSRTYTAIGSIYYIQGETELAFDNFLIAVKTDFSFDKAASGLLLVMKSHPVSEIVSFFDSIYDKDDNMQIGFLTLLSMQNSMWEVFEYYFEKLTKEDTIIYKRYQLFYYLSVAERHTGRSLQKLHINYYAKAIELAEILVDEDKEYESKHKVHIGVARLLDAMLLKGEDFPHGKMPDILHETVRLFDVLELLLKMGAISLAETLLDEFDLHDKCVCYQIAEIFQKIEYYDAAFDFYKMCNDNMDEKTYFGIGFCAYKTGNFEEAKTNFEKISKDERLKSKSAQFLKWVKK